MTRDKMNEAIQSLRKIREKYSLTALEISLALKTSERNVWRWLNNNNSPSPQAIIEIEKFIKETKTKVEKEELEKFERCKALILIEIYDGENGLFHSRPRAGEVFSEANYPVGIAQRDVSLISLSKACAVRLNDPIILKVLDHLAQQGRIKVVLIFVPIRKNFEHMTFKIELAECRRDIPGQDRDFEVIRSYKNKPRTQEEIKASPGILNPKEQVEAIYKRHEDSLRARYGASGLEKEIELHHEKIEDEARARISQLEASESLAKINKGAKKMEGDHRPVSEYTEVKYVEKVREFYEEKITNETNVTQIYYNCNHEKVVIEPGETKIILKMRMIKPMPKAKEVKIIKK